MLWANGKINKVLVGDFKFASRFTGLTDDQLSQAIQIVNAQFSGVYGLWSFLPPLEAQAKRELCINYLIAWWVTQNYPDTAIDVGSSGSMPLKGKKIGPITLQYRDAVRQSGSGVLDLLTTNEFGLQALAMLQTAPEMYLLF